VENFSSITEIILLLNELEQKFGFVIDALDFTGVTFKARLVIEKDVFIQVYFNIKREKFLLALIQDDRRVYGFDKLGEKCHEHPQKEPEKHVEKPCSEMTLEKFIFKAIQIVKEQSHG